MGEGGADDAQELVQRGADHDGATPGGTKQTWATGFQRLMGNALIFTRPLGTSAFVGIAILSVALGAAPSAGDPSEPGLVPGIFLEPRERDALPRGVEIRKVYDKGIQLTASMEGYRHNPYNDPAGFCTIGFGHLIKLAPCDGSEPPHLSKGLSRPAAMALLRDDMELAEVAVMTLASVDLTDGQYAALCDFVYNVGRSRFARSTLLKYVNAGEYGKVPAQFQRYVLANGRKLKGLVVRREKEIGLFWDDLIILRSTPGPDEDLTLIDITAPDPG